MFSKEAESFLGQCKRTREGKISENTSAYSQARSGLGLGTFRALLHELFIELSDDQALWNGRTVLCVDGTTILLPPTKVLHESFPSERNQYSKSPFPVMLVGLAHNVMTGIALEPAWGAMYGPKATCEIRLAQELIQRMPAHSVLIGDRIYGVFSVAHYATTAGHDVIIRFKEANAKALLTKVPTTDTEFEWKPTKRNRKTFPELPEDATVKGRFIVQEISYDDGEPTNLIIFTTLKDVPREEILQLYARRWEIETDIRYLKVTLDVKNLTSRSPEGIEKELLAAVLAYNLVRGVMMFAAREKNLDPKRLSFTNVLSLVRDYAPAIFLAQAQKEKQYLINFIIRFSTAWLNPLPKRKRSYPRTVYKRSQSFPAKSHAF